MTSTTPEGRSLPNNDSDLKTSCCTSGVSLSSAGTAKMGLKPTKHARVTLQFTRVGRAPTLPSTQQVPLYLSCLHHALNCHHVFERLLWSPELVTIQLASASIAAVSSSTSTTAAEWLNPADADSTRQAAGPDPDLNPGSDPSPPPPPPVCRARAWTSPCTCSGHAARLLVQHEASEFGRDAREHTL